MCDKTFIESERFCFLMTVAKLFDDELMEYEIARQLKVSEESVREAIATICMARICYNYERSKKKDH